MKHNEKFRQFEGRVVAAVVTFAVLVCGAYLTMFRDASMGGPIAWGSFGDYVGGLLNPVVGIATVLLVLSTLNTTRSIASETRDQLENQERLLHEQLEVAKNEATLQSIEKRMDGVLSDWESIVSSRRWAEGGVLAMQRGTSVGVFGNLSLKEIFRREEFRSAIQGRNPDDDDDQGIAEMRTRQLGDLAPLIDEMDLYISSYMEHSTANHEAELVTDFYRRRMQPGMFFLANLNWLSSDVVRRMLPKRDLSSG